MSDLIKKLPKVLTQGSAGIFLILVILFAALSISSPYFLTIVNITNLLLQSVFVMLVAFGMMFVLTMGGIDLSIGSILGLSGGVTGMLLKTGMNMWVAILGGLAVGAMMGIINGLIITKIKVPPFLATFAMLNIARGLLMLAAADEPIRQFATPQFEYIAQGYFLGIPVPVYITAVIFVICYILFNWTSFGRYVVTVGSNRQASYLSGVSINNIQIKVYMFSGLMAAVSGILLASRLSSVQPQMGASYELDAIAAAVIGGTSMSGGKGSLVGTMFGALIIAIISNGLDLLSINQFYRMIVTGLIIVIAVGVEHHTSSRSDAG